MKTFVGVLLVLFVFTQPPAIAQHTWQQPKPLKDKVVLQEIIGEINNEPLEAPLNIIWVWGYDAGHAPGSHDYLRVRDLMTGLLGQVDKVSVQTVFHFPSKAQFDNADLIVLYLHLPQLTDAQHAMFESFVARGGGVVAIHETAIIRPASEGKKLVRSLGMSWDEGRSKWGAIYEDVVINGEHEIFRGFGDKLTIVDEFYWDLNHLPEIEVLGDLRVGPTAHSEGPVEESELSEARWPIFWSLEKGKGRVFGTTTGHNTFSYYDPEFRIILFRAMAWVARVDAAPFMPLVFEGITNEKGMVGTTDAMRDWKEKKRGE